MSGAKIGTDAEYAAALARMDALIDDYDANQAEITQLAEAIERWEDGAAEFAEFNAAVAKYKEKAPVLAPKSAEMRRAGRL